jgi:hypothetical protein
VRLVAYCALMFVILVDGLKSTEMPESTKRAVFWIIASPEIEPLPEPAT